MCLIETWKITQLWDCRFLKTHKLFLHRSFSDNYDNFVTLRNLRLRFHCWDHGRSIFKLRYRLFYILKISIFIFPRSWTKVTRNFHFFDFDDFSWSFRFFDLWRRHWQNTGRFRLSNMHFLVHRAITGVVLTQNWKNKHFFDFWRPTITLIMTIFSHLSKLWICQFVTI